MFLAKKTVVCCSFLSKNAVNIRLVKHFTSQKIMSKINVRKCCQKMMSKNAVRKCCHILRLLKIYQCRIMEKFAMKSS